MKGDVQSQVVIDFWRCGTHESSKGKSQESQEKAQLRVEGRENGDSLGQPEQEEKWWKRTASRRFQYYGVG